MNSWTRVKCIRHSNCIFKCILRQLEKEIARKLNCFSKINMNNIYRTKRKIKRLPHLISRTFVEIRIHAFPKILL